MSRIRGGQDVIDALGGLLADADRRALAGDLVEYEVGTWNRIGHEDIWGWFDDDQAIFQPWGFDLAAVRGRVTLYHGDDDKMVPAVNARWLADHLPDADLRLLPGEGHISTMALHFAAALDRCSLLAPERG